MFCGQKVTAADFKQMRLSMLKILILRIHFFQMGVFLTPNGSKFWMKKIFNNFLTSQNIEPPATTPQTKYDKTYFEIFG